MTDGGNRGDALLGLVSREMLAGLEAAKIGLVVAVFEPAGPPRRVFVSDAASDILGYSVDELLSMKPWDSVVAPDREQMQELIAETRQTGAPRPRELGFVRKDGRVVYVQAVPSVASIDGKRAALVFYFDVTERRRAAEALARSEHRLRSLMDSAPEALVLHGPDARILYANPAMLRLLGVGRAEEVVGRPGIEFVHPDDAEVGMQRQRQLIGGGSAQGPQAYRIVRSDGTTSSVEVFSIPLEVDDAPALLSFVQDVTVRKQFEEGMVRADRLAALGQIAAGVAHEINNPLAFARLNAERLASGLRELAGPVGAAGGEVVRADCEEALAAVLTGLDRVAAISRDLRLFARHEPDEIADVDLAEVVGRALAIVGNQVRHRARLLSDVAAGPLRVRANASRLEQVVVNLLVNAAQALPERTVDRNEIRLSVRSDAEGAVIEVADNGPGVPPEIASRIFEPFFTTKTAGDGTGLGLAICEQLVTSYGGHIDVTSGPSGGATFSVWLPIVRTPEARHAPRSQRATTTPAPATASAGTRLRVLVVDDEVAIATILRILIEEHDVDTCTDAAVARDRLLSEDFDVVLCDLMMPGATGMDLWEAVRQARPGREARMIFMTGGAFEGRASEFLQTIPNVVLEKPFGVAAVRAALDEHGRRMGLWAAS